MGKLVTGIVQTVRGSKRLKEAKKKEAEANAESDKKVKDDILKKLKNDKK